MLDLLTSYAIYYYQIYFYCVGETHSGYSAIIHCYIGTPSKKNPAKGTLYFYKDGEAIPASSKSSSGRLELRFNEVLLGNIIDTLRHEKSLSIYLMTSLGGVSTSAEPVGEEEPS